VTTGSANVTRFSNTRRCTCTAAEGVWRSRPFHLAGQPCALVSAVLPPGGSLSQELKRKISRSPSCASDLPGKPARAEPRR
jgi:hypothetical protein